METDADRLASIKGLGGQIVRAQNGSFWAIFDNDFQPALSDGSIESNGPALSACLTSDITTLRIKKGDVIDVENVAYTVRRVETGDVPGWSRVLISK